MKKVSAGVRRGKLALFCCLPTHHMEGLEPKESGFISPGNQDLRVQLIPQRPSPRQGLVLVPPAQWHCMTLNKVVGCWPWASGFSYLSHVEEVSTCPSGEQVTEDPFLEVNSTLPGGQE